MARPTFAFVVAALAAVPTLAEETCAAGALHCATPSQGAALLQAKRGTQERAFGHTEEEQGPTYAELSGYNPKAKPAVCMKDLYGGQYVYCSGKGSFTPNRNVQGVTGCAAQCAAEPGCLFFKSYTGAGMSSICNLFLANILDRVNRDDGDAAGGIYSMSTQPVTTAPPTTTTVAPSVSYAELSAINVNYNPKAKPAVCMKDLYGGQYVYCSGKGSFPAVRDVQGVAGCARLCAAEPGCLFFKSYTGAGMSNICNLFLANILDRVNRDDGDAAGGIYSMSTQPVTTTTATTTQGACYSVLGSYNPQTKPAVCMKDLYGGRYVYCSSGGTFAAVRNVKDVADCARLCKAEPGCTYFKSYTNMPYICNLFKATATDFESKATTNKGDAPGGIYKMC